MTDDAADERDEILSVPDEFIPDGPVSIGELDDEDEREPPSDPYYRHSLDPLVLLDERGRSVTPERIDWRTANIQGTGTLSLDELPRLSDGRIDWHGVADRVRGR